jgi:integrase
VSRFALELRRRKGNKGRDRAALSTVKQRLDLLAAAFRWAHEQGMLDSVPTFPEVKVPKKTPRPVDPAHFEKLLAVAEDEQMKAHLLCGWLAGLRLEEAFPLSWERSDSAPWVDLAGNRIVLPADMVKAVEDQWVPLDPTLRTMLLSLPRPDDRERVFHFTNTQPGRNGKGLPIQANAMVNRVVRLAKKAGVPLTMHALRRGFGCRYASKVEAQVLQRLMRHSNIAVTMGYYANVDSAVMEAVLGPQRNNPRNTDPETSQKVSESKPQIQSGQEL